MGREEDVLHNTSMLLFSGSLPQGFVLDRKLQNHVDDPFPAAGEVEPFGEPDFSENREELGDGAEWQRWGEARWDTPQPALMVEVT